MKTIREFIHPRKESEPWNKGKIIGQEPPLLPKHVWLAEACLGHSDEAPDGKAGSRACPFQLGDR